VKRRQAEAHAIAAMQRLRANVRENQLLSTVLTDAHEIASARTKDARANATSRRHLTA